MLKHSETILRLALAIFLIVLSGDVFFRFFEWPAPSLEGQEYLISQTAATYVWPLTGGVLLVCGILLLFKRFVGLALVGIAPLLLQMVLFFLVFDRKLENTPPGIALLALAIAVGILNYRRFESLWRNKRYEP